MTYYWTDQNNNNIIPEAEKVHDFAALNMSYSCDKPEQEKSIDKHNAVSVRCVKDMTCPTVMTVTPMDGDITAKKGNLRAHVEKVRSAIEDYGFVWGMSRDAITDTVSIQKGADIALPDENGNFEYEIGNTQNCGTLYYVAFMKVANCEETQYGDTIAYVIPNPEIRNCGTITDCDGNTYQTVIIGDQCWMKENLKATHYDDGTEIPLVTDVSQITGYNPYRFAPNGDVNNVEKYGYLYNYQAATRGDYREAFPNGTQGACPSGWRIPSNTDWRQMNQYLMSRCAYIYGGIPDYIAKSVASNTNDWAASDVDHTPGKDVSLNNLTGFSALPAGIANVSGYLWTDVNFSFSNFGSVAYFTHTNDDESGFVYAYKVRSNYEQFNLNGANSAIQGLSVRCVKEDFNPNEYAVNTGSVCDAASPTVAYCGVNSVEGVGGATVSERGLCWSTNQNPTTADNKKAEGSGSGNFTSTISGLTPGTTYYVRAYAIIDGETVYGYMNSVKMPVVPEGDAQPCASAATLTDYDGNVYNTVQLGQQCWMKENLRTSHYADGTAIELGTVESESIPYRYNSLNNSRDGYFYNLAAVMNGAASSNAVPSGVQGVCPDGWHVPSGAEWEQLVEYVGSVEAYTCGCNDLQIGKALASTRAWQSLSIPTYSDWANYMNARCQTNFELSTNNTTGFNAQPTSYIYYNESQGGMYISSGSYSEAIFHSTTFNKTPGSEYYYQFNINYRGRVEGNASGYGVADYVWDSNKLRGHSVRCLKDN